MQESESREEGRKCKKKKEIESGGVNRKRGERVQKGSRLENRPRYEDRTLQPEDLGDLDKVGETWR
jgi:hypothetical protein